jgi:hypothetical protein
MEEPASPTRRQGLTAIDAALALIALLLIVQMWLLSATLESYLGGHHEVALPAAIVSGVMFLFVGGLYLFVHRVDSEAREAHEKDAGPGPR